MAEDYKSTATWLKCNFGYSVVDCGISATLIVSYFLVLTTDLQVNNMTNILLL